MRGSTVSHEDLVELQAMVEALQKGFASFRDTSVESNEIAGALEALSSTVAVHRIRAEIRNSKHPFTLTPDR